MDTTLLRALAIVLIANSHLEDLYPFRPLAADGLLGNLLFFALSGFGISSSPRFGRERFSSWYPRRLARIYPALWVAVILGTVVAAGAWRAWGIRDYFVQLIWPTKYGFISQIVIFYIAYFLLRAARRDRSTLVVTALASASYVLIAVFAYDLHVLSWIFSFMIMLFGGRLAERVDRLGESSPAAIACLTVGLPAYLGVKLAMVLGWIPTQVAITHAIAALLVWSAFELSASLQKRGGRLPRGVGAIVGLLGGITLEIYVIHGYVYESPWVAGMPFPINIAVFWAITIPLASVLRLASKAMGGRLPRTTSASSSASTGAQPA
ncbi:MAG: hypothetical protein SFX72_12210 [Isosphaeraceae bacterium]|nr:hypothetical protein [Isosphaeraceae bacterium]